MREEMSSEAFLTRVREKDAPDYYEVITNPIDLSAMSRKLQNLECVLLVVLR